MKIGEASDQSGVSRKAIRYYESVKLIEAAGRTTAGYRDYSEKDVEILKFISRARGLGFSIPEVSALVDLWKDQNRTSAQVKELAMAHLQQIENKIAELQAMRDSLLPLVDRCPGDNNPDCAILNGLAQRK
ncbi:Cu(I)-responsive transcriptional regulator [Kiloniella sp. b19]|uniref:Cu(I)-responsive transcriptional regulator n=1 Tax=Kiloniella sp. GXU_MW_B19 TaxID=3141326 RepID=UPI0031D27852